MARAIVSATIAFSLVNIAVKLYTSASTEDISFNQITPDNNRVKQKLVDAVTNQEVDRDKLRKGYEYAKDQFVVFSQDEIKALESERSNVMQITEFVPLDAVDFLQVEKSYYLGPDKGGDKGYALLVKTLEKADKVAVATWTARGKDQLVIVRAYEGGLVLHQMYYSTEMRPFDEILNTVAKLPVSPAEEALADKLVETLSKDVFDASKITNTYAERVRKAIQDKLEGKDVTVTANPGNSASVVDIMMQLKASLDKAAQDQVTDAVKASLAKPSVTATVATETQQTTPASKGKKAPKDAPRT